MIPYVYLNCKITKIFNYHVYNKIKYLKNAELSIKDKLMILN